MIEPPLLFEHLLAFALVWAALLLAGSAVAVAFRLRTGIDSIALWGLVYWAVVPYLFPFRGGLDVALILAWIGAIAAVAARWPIRYRRPAPAAWLLLVGCGSFATLFLWNYTPIGIDAGYIGASVRMVLIHRGLPDTYTPWFPDLFFPSVNTTLPFVGAAAVRMGGAAGSVTLALVPVTFSLWILATNRLARRWAPPLASAVIAVACVWGTRWAQNTVGWGGCATIAGLVVALHATRIALDLALRPAVGRALALGLAVAAIPLTHGVSAAVWCYLAVPLLTVHTFATARSPRRTLSALPIAVGVTLAILALYATVGRFQLEPDEIAWSRGHILTDAPQSDGTPLPFASAARYLILYGGEPAGAFLGGALLVLIAMRRGKPLAAAAAAWLILAVLLINCHGWWLPLSAMLYPNRIVYWLAPFAAVAGALAIRSLRVRLKSTPRFAQGAVAVLALGYAFWNHINHYQRIAAAPVVGRQEWEGLEWCRDNLGGGGLVKGRSDSAATFLPVIAGVPATAWQIHHCAMNERRRSEAGWKPAHAWLETPRDPVPECAEVVFRNGGVAIICLR